MNNPLISESCISLPCLHELQTDSRALFEFHRDICHGSLVLDGAMAIAQDLLTSFVVHTLSAGVQHHQSVEIRQCSAKRFSQKRNERSYFVNGEVLGQVNPDNPPSQINGVWNWHVELISRE